MANSYQDTTGVLRLKQVTPVIKALFAGYNLDANYPGNGEAYIGVCESLDAYPDWNRLEEDLQDFGETLGITLTPESSDPLGTQILLALFRKFKVTTHPMAPSLVMEMESSDQPELKWLFNVAQLLDDGHGLEYYQIESAWYCSKPRLGEFGGDGEFRSERLNYYTTSRDAERIGPTFHEALGNRSYDVASQYVVKAAASLLDGITKVYDRQCIAQAAITLMTERYSPIGGYPAASNEPPSEFQQRTFNAAREMFGK